MFTLRLPRYPSIFGLSTHFSPFAVSFPASRLSWKSLEMGQPDSFRIVGGDDDDTDCLLARPDRWMDEWVALRTQILRDPAGCAKGLILRVSEVYSTLSLATGN